VLREYIKERRGQKKLRVDQKSDFFLKQRNRHASGTVIDWNNRCDRFSESVWLCAVAPYAVCVSAPCASVAACNGKEGIVLSLVSRE